MTEVTAVLTNWKRQGNIAPIVKAFLSQTVHCNLIIVDAGGGLSREVTSLADQVISLKKNEGGYNRYIASPFIKTPWAYFHDDDMLPGNRVIEHFLNSATINFSVMGQIGRKLNKGKYSWSGVDRGESHVEVNSLVRGYFVWTANLPLMKLYEHKIGDVVPKHDDLALCLGIRNYTGYPCVLSPYDPDPQTKINFKELDESHALSFSLSHFPERTEFCKLAASHSTPMVSWEGESNGFTG